jgi:hypothetical protein
MVQQEHDTGLSRCIQQMEGLLVLALALNKNCSKVGLVTLDSMRRVYKQRGLELNKLVGFAFILEANRTTQTAQHFEIK